MRHCKPDFKTLAAICRRFAGWLPRGEQKNWQKAEDCYRIALTHEPCLSEAVNNLGALLKRHGRHEEAIRFFDEVMEKCG